MSALYTPPQFFDLSRYPSPCNSISPVSTASSSSYSTDSDSLLSDPVFSSLHPSDAFIDSPTCWADTIPPNTRKLTRPPPSYTSSRLSIAHPYARLYAKREASKRRKIWNHVLEKSLFTPDELASMGAPHRRTIYTASLEAHIDRLHAQLLGIGFFPVAFERLDPFRGLNSRTAKSIVAGLQHDASLSRVKLLELERSKSNLRELLVGQPNP